MADDHPDSPSHAMLTLNDDGSVGLWRYVMGTATTGMRMYEHRDGTRMRHAAPHLRSTIGTEKVAPEVLTTDGATMEHLFEHIRTRKSTYLEDADGAIRLEVVGVEFDAVEALRRILATLGEADGSDPATVPVDVTLCGDGVPVRRRTMTVFTVTVSTEAVRGGRTPLLPLLYLLSPEQAIHSALGERLGDLISNVLQAKYAVQVLPHRRASSEQTTASLRLPYSIRLCGEFAMLCHYLKLTGGGDALRCCYKWPCIPQTYLSVEMMLRAPGEFDCGSARDAVTLRWQWGLIVWVFAR